MLDALAAAVRALLYAGVLSMVGFVLAELTLRPSRAMVEWLDRMTRRAAALTISACVLGTFVLFLRLGGQLDESTVSAVLTSSVGAATGLQLAGALMLLFAVREPSSSPVGRAGNAAIAVASFAFNGHAAVVGFAEGLVAAAHVAAAAWWLGALFLMLHERVHEPMRFAALVRRFAVLALRIVGALVIAGLMLVVILVDFDRDPWFTPYVRTLAIKIAIALTVLALAAYNKLRLTPSLLSGDASAARALRTTITAELLFIGAVLITTAILTTYTSPHE
ncbi:MAG TPA: CopD family protein [Steroidobacteraceae bacterium]|nr:CopD family protein [Steroidobacteraceae bacterium]